MSRWHGPAFEGARRTLQALKRTEAERRNAATPSDRRRRNRTRKPESPDTDESAAPDAGSGKGRRDTLPAGNL